MVGLFRVRLSISCNSAFVHSNIPARCLNSDIAHVLIALNRFPEFSLDFSSFDNLLKYSFFTISVIFFFFSSFSFSFFFFSFSSSSFFLFFLFLFFLFFFLFFFFFFLLLLLRFISQHHVFFIKYRLYGIGRTHWCYDCDSNELHAQAQLVDWWIDKVSVFSFKLSSNFFIGPKQHHTKLEN